MALGSQPFLHYLRQTITMLPRLALNLWSSFCPGLRSSGNPQSVLLRQLTFLVVFLWLTAASSTSFKFLGKWISCAPSWQSPRGLWWHQQFQPTPVYSLISSLDSRCLGRRTSCFLSEQRRHLRLKLLSAASLSRSPLPVLWTFPHAPFHQSTFVVWRDLQLYVSTQNRTSLLMRGHKDWAVIFPQASATSSKLPKTRAQLIGRRVSFHAATHYQIMNLVEGSPIFSPSGLRKLVWGRKMSRGGGRLHWIYTSYQTRICSCTEGINNAYPRAFSCNIKSYPAAPAVFIWMFTVLQSWESSYWEPHVSC